MWRSIWVNDVCIPKLRIKSVWHDQIKYCPNNLKNRAINLSSSQWLAFNIAPSWIWFGCNMCQNLIGKISGEQLNIICWIVYMLRNCQGKLYTWTEWWRWYLILWVPVRYSNRWPLFKLQRGCKLRREVLLLIRGEMLDSNVKLESYVKAIH